MAATQHRNTAPQPFKRSRNPRGENLTAGRRSPVACIRMRTPTRSCRRLVTHSRTPIVGRSAAAVGEVSLVSSEVPEDSELSPSVEGGSSVTTRPVNCPGTSRQAIATSAWRISATRADLIENRQLETIGSPANGLRGGRKDSGAERMPHPAGLYLSSIPCLEATSYSRPSCRILEAAVILFPCAILELAWPRGY